MFTFCVTGCGADDSKINKDSKLSLAKEVMINDFDEIELGLDPLISDSKGDGVKDGERTLAYNYSSDNLKVSITGKGNIANTTVLIEEDNKITSIDGCSTNHIHFIQKEI